MVRGQWANLARITPLLLFPHVHSCLHSYYMSTHVDIKTQPTKLSDGDNQQNKRLMLQCMLGTSIVSNSTMAPSMYYGMDVCIQTDFIHTQKKK